MLSIVICKTSFTLPFLIDVPLSRMERSMVIYW